MKTPQEALRQAIQAIENGQRSEDHRGVVYTQQFGEAFVREAFVRELKKALEAS